MGKEDPRSRGCGKELPRMGEEAAGMRKGVGLGVFWPLYSSFNGH